MQDHIAASVRERVPHDMRQRPQRDRQRDPEDCRERCQRRRSGQGQQRATMRLRHQKGERPVHRAERRNKDELYRQASGQHAPVGYAPPQRGPSGGCNNRRRAQRFPQRGRRKTAVASPRRNRTAAGWANVQGMARAAVRRQRRRVRDFSASVTPPLHPPPIRQHAHHQDQERQRRPWRAARPARGGAERDERRTWEP